MHYNFWSKNLNIHFGYYRLGKPFGLESMLKGMNDLVAQLLNLPNSQPAKILDMGCGFGATAHHLLGLFSNTTITGVNINEAQIAFASERLADPKIRERVKFIVSDFQATPFSDGSFDAAFALESACFAEGENKEKLLLEVARVLRPGSRFVVVDGFRKHGKRLPRLVDWLYKKNLEVWGMPSLAQISGFEMALKQHGFEQVKARDISWNMLPSLAFIPIVATKLFFANLVQKDDGRHWYIRALMLTLALTPFKRHFGYYTVTCVKSSVEFKK